MPGTRRVLLPATCAWHKLPTSLVMALLVYFLASLCLVASALSLFRVRSITGLMLWLPKILAGSASIFVVVFGLIAAILGVIFAAHAATIVGLLAAFLSLRYILRATAPHDGFVGAFGSDWQEQITPGLRADLLKRRWNWRLPAHRDVRLERDIVFWTLSDETRLGSERALLCDLWQPPQDVTPSGLALIYFHGGAWHWMDKDFGTRPFFGHLASQGHVVMDVAYRMCPEVDLYGMLGDVKRAIAWMKANAQHYGVDPDRLVLAGGSAGGHLALLAAYTPAHPGLTPDDLRQIDLKVQAVIACYSPADMIAISRYFAGQFGSYGEWANQGLGRLLSRVFNALAGLMRVEPSESTIGGDFSFAWLMNNLLGGSLEERPAAYSLASPITHVCPDSPPTLILQGEHDCMATAHISRTLYEKLDGLGVKAVFVEFPQTEHAFDLVLPRYAPAAQAALYDIDRFLALLASSSPQC